jgi:hypothetical protein
LEGGLQTLAVATVCKRRKNNIMVFISAGHGLVFLFFTFIFQKKSTTTSCSGTSLVNVRVLV